MSTELVAVQALLDKEHQGPEYLPRKDENDYALGKVGKHNIVIAECTKHLGKAILHTRSKSLSLSRKPTPFIQAARVIQEGDASTSRSRHPVGINFLIRSTRPLFLISNYPIASVVKDQVLNFNTSSTQGTIDVIFIEEEVK